MVAALTDDMLHRVIDEASGSASTSWAAQYPDQDAAELADVVEGYKSVIKTAVATAQGKDEISASLQKIGVSADQSTKDAVTISSRMTDLREAAAAAGVSVSNAQLSDLDWKLQVTMASSSISTMQRGQLLLSLSIKSADGAVKDEVVELGKSDVDRLIASLSEASRAVQSCQM